MEEYFVYVIGKKEDLVHPFDNCYIGVSKDIKRRWKNHTRSKFRIGHFIRKYSLTFEDNMIVIFSGPEKIAFEKEFELRPEPIMGLNEAAGGKGGTTKYTSERNKKISKKLKGQKRTPEQIKRIKDSKKDAHHGNKNPNSKKWIIFSPANEKFVIYGELFKFCEEKQLTFSLLRKADGIPIPEVNTKKFHPKNKDLLARRFNSVGWISIKEK